MKTPVCFPVYRPFESSWDVLHVELISDFFELCVDRLELDSSHLRSARSCLGFELRYSHL
jgi:hypothetical protein